MVTLFLCGDVMLGRGIDQVQRHRCAPHIYEPALRSAVEYVRLAERANGPVPRAVDPAYVWGEALGVLDRVRPDTRIVNLETSVTTSEDAAPKAIQYRMHPGNVAVLAAARIDCCSLANNHVLDWGEAGLRETLAVLSRAGIATAGAGEDAPAAARPARVGRVLVVAAAATDSGVPADWRAGPDRAGLFVLPDFGAAGVASIADSVAGARRGGDVVVASIHWGGNWGYGIPAEHRRFAHALIERAGVHVVHGHSSHHPRAVEIHRGRPILYGCGDFLDDYEGIAGREEFRGDLVLMYFVSLGRDGGLARLAMVPLRIRRFRLGRPPPDDRAWLLGVLDRECRRFGRRVVEDGDMFVVS